MYVCVLLVCVLRLTRPCSGIALECEAEYMFVPWVIPSQDGGEAHAVCASPTRL